MITVGNTPTVTVAAPQIGTRSVATLSFTGGLKTDVLGFSLGARVAGSGGSAGRKATVRDISITKQVDKSSPKLFQACVTGQHFKTATLVVGKAGGTKLTYTLSDVIISSAQTESSKGKAVPNETLTLNFTKLALTYK